MYLKIHLLCFCTIAGAELNEDVGLRTLWKHAVSLVGIPLPFQGMFRISASQRQSYSLRASQLWLFVRTFWKAYELQHGRVGPIPQRFRLKSSPKMAMASVCSKSSLGDSAVEPGGRTLSGEMVTSQAHLAAETAEVKAELGPPALGAVDVGLLRSACRLVGFLSHGAKE